LDWTCQRLQVDQPRWRRAVRCLPAPWLGAAFDEPDDALPDERAVFPRGQAGRRVMEALGWSEAPTWQEVPFALVPAGRFMMGSPDEEPGRDADERQREVDIEHPFLIMRVPVTQGLWSKFSKQHRARFVEAGPEAPAERVTWFEAALFANAMSAQEGLPLAYEKRGRADCEPTGAEGGFRLPSEAEWEYACRALTLGPSYGGGDVALDELAWFGLAPQRRRAPVEAGREPGTRKVAQKRPNPWGLYDTLGNVWEWCQDARDGDEPARVVRGGAWSSEPRFVRAAQRGWAAPDAREHDVGFRLVRRLS
jgi:formylglycine-generating enzyme required for sulfatase activity